MLEAPVPFAVESTLHLRLVLGGQRVGVDARVRGCAPRSQGRGRAWGVGVQFENLEPAARERLERALAAAEEGPGLTSTSRLRSFSKRGLPRSGSKLGSMRSQAGVR